MRGLPPRGAQAPRSLGQEPTRAPIRQRLFLAAGIGLGCGLLNVAAKAAPSALFRWVFCHSAGSCIATIYGLQPGLHRARSDRLRLAVCSARYSRCLSRRQAARGGQAIAARFGSDSSGWLGEKNGAGKEGDRGGRRNGGTRRAESLARLAAGRAIVAGGALASRTECAASCLALPCRGGGGSPGALSLAAVRGRLRVHDFAAKLDRAPPGALRVLFYGVGARSQNPFTATLTRK